MVSVVQELVPVFCIVILALKVCPVVTEAGLVMPPQEALLRQLGVIKEP